MCHTRTLSTRVRLAVALPRTALVALVAVVAAIAALLQGLAAQAADAATASPSMSYLSHVALSDSFNRSVNNGWGRAPLGGAYHGAGSTGTARTFAGNAYFSNVRSGHSRVQVATVTNRDMLVSASLAFSAIPRSGSWGEYVALELREQSDGAAYTATVHVTPRGRAWLQIDRHPATGSAHTLVARSLGTVVAGRGYYLQAGVVGNRLWARLYRIGSRAPSWLTTTDSSGAAVTSAGSPGVVLATVGSSHAIAGVHLGAIKVLVPNRAPATTPTPPVITAPVVTPPAPAPSTSTPAPAPSTSTPAPAPSTSTPAPAPSTSTPAPAPSTSTPAPAPSTSTPAPAPSTSTPAPAPSGPQHAAAVLAAAGSAPIGSTHYAIPAGAVFVATTGSDANGDGSQAAPFATLARALKAAPYGGTVVLRGGTYHADTLVMPSVKVTVQAYPGEAVWFDGSVPVTGWTQSGNVWIHNGWTAQFDHSASYTSGSNEGGFVNPAFPMAAWPDMVFVDGVPLQQVAANPSAGEFAVNYANQQIIVGSDPSGHAVRASDLSQAFVIGGTMNLLGIGVRNYAASLPNQGMIYIGNSAGSMTYENDVLEHSATTAITINSKHMTFNHVSALDNGMTGVTVVYGDGGVIENCLFAGNNIEHFNAAPDGAGIKLERTNGVVVKDNVSRDGHNIAGIWTDENVVNFSITGNVIQNNGNSSGIANELSGTGIVANNTITGSSYGYTAMDSGNITVANNDVDNNKVWDIGLSQDNRWQPGMGTAGPNVQPSASNPWLVQNVDVVDNNFGRSNGAFQFYVLDKETNRPARSMNLSVQGNMFAPRDSDSKPYAMGWGMGDNDTVHTYATGTAFDAGEGYAWLNSTAPSGTGLSIPSAAAIAAAMPLPSSVATAIAQIAGIRGVGTF